MDLIEKYKQKISKIQISSIKELDMLASGNHQGIVAEVEEYGYVSLEEVIKKHKDDKNVSLAILDGLEDPHNLGAILRSADASGIDGIIIPKIVVFNYHQQLQKYPQVLLNMSMLFKLLIWLIL